VKLDLIKAKNKASLEAGLIFDLEDLANQNNRIIKNWRKQGNKQILNLNLNTCIFMWRLLRRVVEGKNVS